MLSSFFHMLLLHKLFFYFVCTVASCKKKKEEGKGSATPDYRIRVIFGGSLVWRLLSYIQLADIIIGGP